MSKRTEEQSDKDAVLLVLALLGLGLILAATGVWRGSNDCVSYWDGRTYTCEP